MNNLTRFELMLPLLIDMSTPNYEECATKLYEAMKGAGSNKQTIIAVLATLTSEQIVRDVAEIYQQKYKADLYKVFEKELRGDLENLVLKLATPRYINWCRALVDNIKNKRQPAALARFVSLIDHQDRFRIVENFEAATGEKLEEFLSKLDKQEQLKEYVKSILYNEYSITVEGIEQFVNICKTGTTPGQLLEFIATLDQSSAATFRQKFRESFEDDFVMFVRGQYQQVADYVEMRLQALENPVAVVADLLYYSMKGAGTDEETLNYTTAIFRDYHWKNLQQAYKQHGDVTKDIKGDTSGQYQNCLLRLWGLMWF